MRRFAFAVLSVVVASARGQIVLKPSGDDAIKLSPKTVDVRADLRGGVADTVWTYTFANEGRFRGQADFLIAIPKGGVVHGFAYWYQGEKVVARITEKERAKRIYQAIVTRQRDPALIEMVGKNTFRVRVFPIDGDADLKVELKMAQVLNPHPALTQGGGSTYSIPLRSLGKLESATVEVTGEQKLQGSWGPVGPSLKYSIANSNAADLKVTEAWAPQALHASLRAARSGGPGGFFALTLTPSQVLARRRWRLEGDVADVIEVAGSGGSVTLVGRYRKPGPVRAWLIGDGYKASADLTMSDRVEANGPATKLWAWSKIGHSKDRKEIVALSERHGVPSKYTSWIAIPTEERKRMAREIAQADLKHEVKLAIPGILRYGADSAQGRAALARLDKRARSLGISLKEIYDEQLSAAASETGAKWAKAVVKSGEDSDQAKRLKRDFDVLSKFSYYGSDTEYLFRNIAYELAPQVIDDRLHDRKGGAAATRERGFRVAALHAREGKKASDSILQDAAQTQMWQYAEDVIQAERSGKSKSRAERTVRKLARATGMDADGILRLHRLEAARNALRTYDEAVQKALQKGDPSDPALRKDAAKRAREAAIIRANGGTPQLWALSDAARNSAYRRVQKIGAMDGEAEIQKQLNAIAKAAGVPDGVDWAEAWLGVYSGARNERDMYEQVPRRDAYDQAVAAEARLKEIEALVPPETIQRYNRDHDQYSSWNGYEGWKLRNEYIEARHRGEQAEDLLNRFYQAEKQRDDEFWRERAPLRRDILRTLTELDNLDRQKPDADVVARKAELEAKEKELRARMGDPIVSIEAPGAHVVVAKMPDGTWLPMHRVAGTDRWEGRFDVPAGIADGRYAIFVFVDGERKAAVPINVDTAAPSVEVRWDGGRAEVLTDADVKRVAGFTPAGERVELTREAPGRFAARVPEGTAFVATDGAHNRSDLISSLPSGGEGAGGEELFPSGGVRGKQPFRAERATVYWTSPGTVSAMAFVGDRLWVGTANDGGGFEDEARDGERPWVKSAVAYGDGLAVRYADGEVAVRRHGGPRYDETLKLPRRSTCLAADGETLLVGTIGGFFEVRGEGRKDVFPKELAGLVVTALLRDGNRTWVGTQGRGLAEVGADGKVVWHDERLGLRDDWVTCLGRDAQGRVVVGTFVGGASVLDGGWKAVDGTSGTCVTGISGQWIATRQGVLRDGQRVSDEEATALWCGETKSGSGRGRGRSGFGKQLNVTRRTSGRIPLRDRPHRASD